MKFLSIPTLGIDDEPGVFYLASVFLIQTASGETVAIPVRYRTDFASIPRLLHSLIPVNGKHRLPSILHDYLYTIQDRSRAECDALFLDAMKTCGVRFTQRWAMYSAVRIGGWVAWNARKAKMEADENAYRIENGL